MNKIKPSTTIWITLIGFVLFYTINRLFFVEWYNRLNEFIGSKMAAYTLAYLLVGIPIFLSTYFLKGKRDFFEVLGLKSDIIKAFGIALLATLPMFLGYLLSFEFDKEQTFTGIYIGSVNAAFFEELYYRGFFFGMLYRFTRLGFLPSILLCALVFGSVHLYQSEDVATMVGIFLTTFIGAGLFAWVYAEWDFNLWVPIALHLFMNMWWDLFDVSGNALGGMNANIFRVITIVVIIAGTVIYKSRNQGLEVNRKTLWMKSVKE